MRYDPAVIEPKWQEYWEDHDTFRTPDVDPSVPKFYALGMFPYPSGAGLHVGHPESYTALDIVARYKRKNGFNVLHPMGWDAFGLPAERHAVRTGRHPAEITRENVANFKQQLQRLGFSYDWGREINTSEPDYYRWTQWIFLKLYEQDLAYLAEVPVNWCPAQGTVLSNEEVQDGKYVETGDPVERRNMKQWMLKITAYAQRLLDDLDEVDWPEHVKEMQRQWIGRSEGADVQFRIDGTGDDFTVFTTRPDTLFGATYCVLAPEHPLVERVTSADRKDAVDAYVRVARNRSDRERQVAAEKEKTGIFTGAFALNPVNGAKVPIWVADYVLITYGTGAIMAVPAHDERDHAFARKFGLDIVPVYTTPDGHDIQEAAWPGEGTAVNSGDFDGMSTGEFKDAIIAWLEDNGLGVGKVQYKLRDWLFSRQRYWGEPFPIVHRDDGTYEPVAAEQLPVTLPHVDAYKPTADGQPPLARAEDWLITPEGLRRETNTMPQWAGSCWYYLRYMDARNDQAAFSPEAEDYWGPVDLYIGGVEHAVLHLLYARFWHKVLYDCGLVHTKEPFAKLFNQGMILAFSYRDAAGKYYYPHDCEERDGAWFAKDGTPVDTQIEKMSKSRFNVTNPNDVVDRYGADALRLYEMFMGPLEQVKPWQASGVEGVYRFLARTWRLFVTGEGELNPAIGDHAADRELNRSMHVAIKSVTDGVETLRFNTPISRMMEFVKVATARKQLPRSTMESFVQILAPYAPHLAEELWQRLGHSTSLAYEPWPRFDPAALVDDTVTITVQVQGKRRGQIEVAKDADRGDILAAAKAVENVARHLDGMTIVKEIVVPGRLVNLVVRPAT
ncbi:MAG TPA: leucine--tRNA ligase [Myxococcota bacterium]|nr:leucine--tRNA ligase [Myxococcota bacterium]